MPESRIAVRQIHLVIEHVMQRVLERTGQELACEVHAQELRVGIEHLVAGHGGLSTARRNDDTFTAPNTRHHAASSVSTLVAVGTYPTTSLGGCTSLACLNGLGEIGRGGT